MITKLLPHQQAEWLANIGKLPPPAQSAAIRNAVESGLIDEPAVIMHRDAVDAFKTNDPDTLKLKAHAELLARRNEPVLVLGESGTGKELIANILHGSRRGSFTAVNVCAVTDTLFESELFGHIKGAFTGADKHRDGLITQAKDGTLFLDEIGDMPLHLQAKMLRVVQQRTYRRVGSSIDEPVQCRIVCATHRDLPMMIEAKQFREDLYHRLSVFKLSIKPLRQRLDDIYCFLERDSVIAQFIKQNITEVGCGLFSGNVRQLLNLRLRYEVFGEEVLTRQEII